MYNELALTGDELAFFANGIEAVCGLFDCNISLCGNARARFVITLRCREKILLREKSRSA